MGVITNEFSAFCFGNVYKLKPKQSRKKKVISEVKQPKVEQPKAKQPKAKQPKNNIKSIPKQTARRSRSPLHDWSEVWSKASILPIMIHSNNAKVISYMHKNGGIQLSDYAKIDLPSKRQISQCIAIISKKGYGIEFEDNTYKLVLPKGMNRPYIKERV